MKKFLFLFLFAATFIACSSDDDADTTGDDPIVGVWYLAEINNGEALGFEMTDCISQSSLDFQSDGTALSEFYSESNGNCSSETGEVTWSSSSDSNYNIELPFEGIGQQPGRVEFNQDNTRFTFYPTLLQTQNTNFVFEKR